MDKNFVLFYQRDLNDGTFISIRKSFKKLKSLFIYLNYEFPNIDDVDFSIFDISIFPRREDNDKKFSIFSLSGGSDE